MDNPINISKKKSLFFILLFIVFTALSISYITNIFGNGISFQVSGIGMLVKLVIASIVYYLLDAYRLAYILRSLGEKVSFWYLLKLSFINVFFSNITPMATGGGFLQVYLLNKKGVRLSKAVVASSLRTFFALGIFLLLVPINILSVEGIRGFFFNSENYRYSISVLIGYLGFLGFIIKIMSNKKNLIRLIIGLKRRFKRSKDSTDENKLIREILSFYRYLNILIKNPRVMISSIFITFMFLISLFYIPYLLIINLGGSPSLFEVLSIQSIVTFFTYFAFTPGASGLAELILTMFYIEHLPNELLATYAFMWRVFTIYVPMIIGGWLLLKNINVTRRISSSQETQLIG